MAAPNPALFQNALAASNGAVDLSSFAQQYPPAVIQAAQNIFSAEPSQLSTFQSTYGGNLTSWLNSFTQWWSNYGNTVAGNMAQYAPEQGLLSALGYTAGQGGNYVAGPTAVVQAPPLGSTTPGSNPNPSASTTSGPAEQQIYNEVIPGLNAEILNDQNLATDTTNLTNQTISNYGALGNVYSQAIAAPGQLSQVTQQENQAIDQSTNDQIQQLSTAIDNQKSSLTNQIASLTGDADASAQAQLQNLQTQLAQLNTAEASVAAARTAAAQGQVTAVNVALAKAQNQIQGQAALQGFVGGSTMLDNALVQAGIGASQNAANDVGDASLQNALDYQSINNLGANSQNTIGNTLATQTQAISDQGANTLYGLDQTQNQTDFNIQQTADTSKQNNVQNQYGQSLQASLADAALPGNEAAQIASIDPLQNTGLLDAQQALNWWTTNSQAPTPTTTTTTASTTGNTIANAGANLLSGAISLGNSKNWWQSSPTTPTTSGGSTATTSANQLF